MRENLGTQALKQDDPCPPSSRGHLAKRSPHCRHDQRMSCSTRVESLGIKIRPDPGAHVVVLRVGRV